jgi:UDP-2-acetamido-3-amino-2,3-dideoxy-glucuronate N-acetyltransferase
MSYFKHNRAIVETDTIGKDTRIWAFSHILPGAIIGEDCNICDHTFIENDVIIGNRVTIKSGVQLWDGIIIENDVFIGPNATFTNDPFPRSKQYLKNHPKTIVKIGASIGANSTILPGLIIGQHAMVGAGAVVTKNVPPYAIVVGNPARIVDYVKSDKEPREKIIGEPITQTNTRKDLKIKQAWVIELPLIVDMRGNLSVIEFEDLLPFKAKRCFWVFDVSGKHVRGEHAHKTLQQFLICIKGSCSVVLDDGFTRQEITLDKPNKGLYLPPLVWGTQYKHSQDCVLVVFASDIYDPSDYIRDYNEFKEFLLIK